MKGFKEFAEQYYWNHTARFHFIAVMARGFNRETVLPEKFVKCLKEKLSEDVILKGPSGNLWLVKLMKVEDDLLLKDGWREFVEAHNIEECDMLSFEYEGHSCFNVFIYDTRDQCERETSYFARNHKNVFADRASSPMKQSVGDSAENLLKFREVQSSEILSDDNPQVDQLSPPGFHTSSGKTASNSHGVESADRRDKINELPVPTTGSAENILAPDNCTMHFTSVHCDDSPQVELLTPPGTPASNGKSDSSSLGIELAKQGTEVGKSELEDHTMDSVENMQSHQTPDNVESDLPREEYLLSSEKFRTSGRRTVSKSHSLVCTGCSKTIKKGDCMSRGKGGRPRKFSMPSTELKPVQLRACEKSTYEMRYEMRLISNRRPVTTEERDRALQLAGEIKPGNPFFRVVMRDSHVYKGHFMTIPSEFVAEHQLLKWRTADLCVHDSEDTWKDVRIQPKSSTGLAGVQWRNFVQDNNLEEGDVCVFELHEAEKCLEFDVHIFRVVNEITPLTKESR